MTFEIPSEKLARLLEGGKFLLLCRRVHVKDLASWVGLLQSVRLAVGPIVSLMCHFIYDDIKGARSWQTYLKLTDKCEFELRWWMSSLSALNSYPICKEPSIV